MFSELHFVPNSYEIGGGKQIYSNLRVTKKRDAGVENFGHNNKTQLKTNSPNQQPPKKYKIEGPQQFDTSCEQQVIENIVHLESYYPLNEQKAYVSNISQTQNTDIGTVNCPNTKIENLLQQNEHKSPDIDQPLINISNVGTEEEKKGLSTNTKSFTEYNKSINALIIEQLKKSGSSIDVPNRRKTEGDGVVSGLQFECTLNGCGKKFTQKAHLLVHARIHLGIKPFVCEHSGCRKSFSQMGNLRTHVRMHTGEKPFVCQYENCKKKFSQMGNLKTHISKIHSKN
ncbi:hypothetical protein BB559_002108 [Furculomyces boomerangus]|uniref:C2H2-type domain-containing protein n=1 Tax=Furculomyces boomerangus TaxID=61424 RepID=A0A2T9YY06_9FUNG|nr:hypothetical protein BB559_002108 [Furculomyces boomerangus]